MPGFEGLPSLFFLPPKAVQKEATKIGLQEEAK
jgi:hypothetical protein